MWRSWSVIRDGVYIWHGPRETQGLVIRGCLHFRSRSSRYRMDSAWVSGKGHISGLSVISFFHEVYHEFQCSDPFRAWKRARMAHSIDENWLYLTFRVRGTLWSAAIPRRFAGL